MKASSLAALLLTFAGPLMAQAPATPPAADPAPATPPATPPAETKPPENTPPKRKTLKFSPPKDAASGTRRDGDGGSRDGGKHKYPKMLYALLPENGEGLTTMAQPSLFSYHTDAVDMEFRITVTEPGQKRPRFVYAVSHAAAGIHRVNLADYDITLKPGVTYNWNVILRPDPKKPSADLQAAGTIKRIEPDAALADKIKTAPSADLPAIYAEHGIWFDALATLSDQIAANPKDADLKAQLQALLDQAKFKTPIAVK